MHTHLSGTSKVLLAALTHEFEDAMPLDLDEIRNRRDEFLLAVYELADGDFMVQVSTRQVAERAHMDYETEASKIGRYWRGVGAVHWESFEWICLTGEGLSIAEEILEKNRQRLSSFVNDIFMNRSYPQCHQSVGADAKFCEHCGTSLDKFNATTIVGTDDAATTLIKQGSLIGKVIASKYEILEQLGEGGGGTVYRAHRLHLDDDVALKVLLDRHLADPAFRGRFRREASAAAKIRHPNIVQIYDFSEGDGTSLAYLVMELVEGESLATLLEKEGRLEPTRAARLAIEVASGVSAAHKEGIFHRDLKPSNLIVLSPMSESASESVKIIDFGIAKFRDGSAGNVVTQGGQVLGTYPYMSPEQCRGKECDARSDVYSIGVILYEMIAGKPPFTATNSADIVVMHLQVPPAALGPKFGVAPELEAVIMRALEKDRSARQADAAELLAELKKGIQAQSRNDSFHGKPEPSVEVELSTSKLEKRISELEESNELVFNVSCQHALQAIV